MLLENDGSVLIHKRNLQILVMKRFSVSKGFSRSVITELSEYRDKQHSNQRGKNTKFKIYAIKTHYYGSERISFLGSTI